MISLQAKNSNEFAQLNCGCLFTIAKSPFEASLSLLQYRTSCQVKLASQLSRDCVTQRINSADEQADQTKIHVHKTCSKQRIVCNFANKSRHSIDGPFSEYYVTILTVISCNQFANKHTTVKISDNPSKGLFPCISMQQIQ